jgi:multidrug transporter EmrE-like cation transporter
MKDPWIAVIALLCNAAAQFAMKYAGRNLDATDAAKGLAMWLSPWLLVALAFYGLSFLLVVRVYAANPLSVASPVLAGGTFFLITLISWLLLGESLGYQKIAGIALIFLGIVVLTRAG